MNAWRVKGMYIWSSSLSLEVRFLSCR
ncbi:hypothetical protein ACHAW6_007270 [Cyclotella cf. meneghiniana]